jgi:hypothetical protein
MKRKAATTAGTRTHARLILERSEGSGLPAESVRYKRMYKYQHFRLTEPIF